MDQLNRLHATLRRAMAAFEGAGVPFHCTGGLVTTIYGEPRLTQDIDVVAQIDGLGNLEALLDRLSPEFFTDEEAAKNAWQAKKMFQALDRETYIKVDVHIGEDVPGELGRTEEAEIIPGLVAPVVRREDAILSKLLWITKGSHKSRQDVVGMLRRPGRLDRVGLRQSAAELDVATLLKDLETEANDAG